MGKIKEIYIFALAATGSGISGSDRIFIELARRWSKVCSISIHVDDDGYKMCQNQHLKEKSIKYKVLSIKGEFGFVVKYLLKIVKSIGIGLNIKLKEPQNTLIYSASEFWMDVLPAFILKLRYPKLIWAASWYQTAPNPLVGFAEGNREKTYKLQAFFYWFMQFFIKPFISTKADSILINNKNEETQFPRFAKQNRLVVVQGAVDLQKVKSYQMKKVKKIYDGVFQGRFHPQKGVVELIDIWQKVVEEKPDAKLVMIGDGPLRKSVELRIKNLGLNKNIILKGYLFDGDEKYKIFQQSKVVLHPAFFDSGGMAAAEAMAFGLPCVGFDLASYKYYYPKGMIKVDINDKEKFAKTIVKLLNEKNLYKKIANEALEMIAKMWSWDTRAKEVFSHLTK